MKKHIVFDIDGVVRDLYSEVKNRFGVNITDWYWKHKGMNIYDLAKLNNYEFVKEAKTTKYYEIIHEYLANSKKAEFWSHQSKDWRKHTIYWLKKHFDFNYEIKYYTPQQKYKNLLKSKNTILIDDFPFFSDYEKIVLIDAPYNKNSKAHMRVSHKEQLKNLLESYR